MFIDTATTKYRMAKLSEELASMAEDFSGPLEDARKLEAPLVGLHLLKLVHQLTYDSCDLDEIITVAMSTLPNSTDSSATEAVLKGAMAMRRQQSEKLWELSGLAILALQPAASASDTAAAQA